MGKADNNLPLMITHDGFSHPIRYFKKVIILIKPSKEKKRRRKKERDGYIILYMYMFLFVVNTCTSPYSLTGPSW